MYVHAMEPFVMTFVRRVHRASFDETFAVLLIVSYSGIGIIRHHREGVGHGECPGDQIHR